jgi:hypothetical protein
MKDSRVPRREAQASARTPLPVNIRTSDPVPGTPGAMVCSVAITAVMDRLLTQVGSDGTPGHLGNRRYSYIALIATRFRRMGNIVATFAPSDLPNINQRLKRFHHDKKTDWKQSVPNAYSDLRRAFETALETAILMRETRWKTAPIRGRWRGRAEQKTGGEVTDANGTYLRTV